MRFLLRVAVKGLLLFLALNVLAGLLVEPRLGHISIYNSLVPGRPRFPFGESPREAYNFSLFDVDAMFAAHEIAGAGEPHTDEFRVLLIGDSSVWGTLLRPEETLAGQLNALGLTAADGRAARFYNLGYPTISLAKDLLVLDQALQYQPDQVIWLTTLEAFPRSKQLAVPLLENNPSRARDLVERYRLDLPVEDLQPPAFWERTLIGRRKALADGIRLQMYGLLWAATGVDQVYPSDYPRAQTDLEPDPTFQGSETLDPDDLALEAFTAAQRVSGDVPLLVVNEPILISSGANSEIRYNFYYPRGAYDQYRQILAETATAAGIPYLDAWDSVPPEMFTNSAIHLDARGTALLAEQIAEALR
jgi:hypothetical protein